MKVDTVIQEPEPPSQTCKRCGITMRFEFAVQDELWALVPLVWRKHVLCIECFLKVLDERGENLRIDLADFVFMGIVGQYLDGPIFLDKNAPIADLTQWWTGT